MYSTTTAEGDAGSGIDEDDLFGVEERSGVLPVPRGLRLPAKVTLTGDFCSWRVFTQLTKCSESSTRTLPTATTRIPSLIPFFADCEPGRTASTTGVLSLPSATSIPSFPSAYRTSTLCSWLPLLANCWLFLSTCFENATSYGNWFLNPSKTPTTPSKSSSRTSVAPTRTMR